MEDIDDKDGKKRRKLAAANGGNGDSSAATVTIWFVLAIIVLLCLKNLMTQLKDVSSIDDGSKHIKKIERLRKITFKPGDGLDHDDGNLQPSFRGERDLPWANRYKSKKHTTDSKANADLSQDDLERAIYVSMSSWIRNLQTPSGDSDIDDGDEDNFDKIDVPGQVQSEELQEIIDKMKSEAEKITQLKEKQISIENEMAEVLESGSELQDFHSLIDYKRPHIESFVLDDGPIIPKTASTPAKSTNMQTAATTATTTISSDSNQNQIKPSRKIPSPDARFIQYLQNTLRKEKTFVSIPLENPLLASSTGGKKSSTSPQSKTQLVIESSLKSLGYKPATGSNSPPLWSLAYGSNCPENPSSTIILCPHYIPLSGRFLPFSALQKESLSVVSVLAGVAASKISAEAESKLLKQLDYHAFWRSCFKLYEIGSAITSIAGKSTYFAISASDGAGPPMLTNKVSSFADEKKYGSKKLVAQEHPTTLPLLWNGHKFVIRSWGIIFRASPLLALYHEGVVIKGSEPFMSLNASSIELINNKPGSHFPSTGLLDSTVHSKHEAPVIHSLDDLHEYLTHRRLLKPGMLKNVIMPRIKQILTLTILSLRNEHFSQEQQSDKIYVQHICADFSIDASDGNVWLEQMKSNCPIIPSPTSTHVSPQALQSTALSYGAIRIAEELLYRKDNSLPSSFEDLSTTKGFDVLIDESKDQAALVKSLLIDESPASSATTATTNACLLPQSAFKSADSNKAYNDFIKVIPMCDNAENIEIMFGESRSISEPSGTLDASAYNERTSKALEDSIISAKDMNWQSSFSQAQQAGYTLCRSVEHYTAALVWKPKVTGNAFLALQMFTCSTEDGESHHGLHDLIIEIPHPQFDHTRAEAFGVFHQSRAKALIMSGSHRCADGPPSYCTGSIGRAVKTNCAGRDFYTNADVAHSVNNMFWHMHVKLSEIVFPTSIVVSLHSTKQDSFVISDGTSANVDKSTPVAVMGVGLKKHFNGYAIEACNSYEGAPNTRKLSEEEQGICGATNVQGRHLNGSNDPCRQQIKVTGEPLVSSNRFVHIEQPVVLVKGNQATSTAYKMASTISEYFDQLRQKSQTTVIRKI